MEELYKLLQESLNERLYQITAGGPRKKDGAVRLKLRPVMIKDELCFQMESYRGNQVFHHNVSAAEAMEEMGKAMEDSFRQLDVETMDFQAVALVSKKGKITIKKKKSGGEKAKELSLSHNRAKKYILEEGKPVPFLVDLGVQTQDGRIVKSRYDKFRQINRFLEFIADIMPILPKDRCVRIIDFGCGKSYLTFVMYYYLHELCGLDIRVTGLDLKKEVIRHCQELADKYGYEGLEFLQGDIADYSGEEKVDMVVTLHACDTATDYALYKAVCWNAEVILSVPCCQHEMNRQIACDILKPALKYGLVKERMSALLTDALRGNLLEEAGYDTHLLEFIDMEHTPKNILIRAVKRKGTKSADTGIQEMTDFLHVHTCLQELLKQ
ncbi:MULTISPECIES: class I SAM-dependent methyltransferase [Eisenbergiella]|uniref:class I SAM-dependent methyltransferase n=1 Tax=Eisenbergiella TaxID=1432051 RepID=UPI0023F1D976|nr:MULTISPECIES: SAM-dependent methyltransferase [Eisenbergiella]MCI6705916.1 SAM-dependent methyltransferase [Eisenbergiella massiliensis]MDY5525599.1 SAM-dependent methyltransferase [Eisenbergiella porci]